MSRIKKQRAKAKRAKKLTKRQMEAIAHGAALQNLFLQECIDRSTPPAVALMASLNLLKEILLQLAEGGDDSFAAVQPVAPAVATVFSKLSQAPNAARWREILGNPRVFELGVN